MNDWLAEFKAEVRAASWMTPAHRRNCWSIARFCGTHHVMPTPPGMAVSLWGFGEIIPIYAPADDRGEWWAHIDSLSEPTGIPRDVLYREWHREREDACLNHEAGCKTEADQLVTVLDDGRKITDRLWSAFGVMGLFMGLSPWRKEFFNNLRPAFRRAAVLSGIADEIPIARIDEQGNAMVTGETYTDVILADGPLPSSEVARHQAMAGPLAALDEDGDDCA